MATSFGYYGTRRDMTPPPGYSRRAYREAVQRGKLPGHKLPGRGGVVVAVAEWDAWLARQNASAVDPIEADIRRRFHVA